MTGAEWHLDSVDTDGVPLSSRFPPWPRSALAGEGLTCRKASWLPVCLCSDLPPFDPIALFAMTVTPFALPCAEPQARLVVSSSQQPLPTGHFPRDVSRLERAELEEAYRKLRFHYRGLMISRGIHRSRCHRQAEQLQDLGRRLRSMALEQASERAQIYAVLEQITNLAQTLEADGDDLAASYHDFRVGGHHFAGAARIGGLIQSVIRFLNNWQRHKRTFRQLIAGSPLPSGLVAGSEQGADRH